MLRSDFDTVGPCVVMAAPGFMQVHAPLLHYLYTLPLLWRTAFSSVFSCTTLYFISTFLSCTALPFHYLFTAYPSCTLPSLPCLTFTPPTQNEILFSQTGVSRHLFERWCDDERNGVVLAGYTVEGTLAHDLLNHPTGKSSKV